jgi:hypothetical protein
MKKMRRNPLHGWTKLGFVVLLLAVAANSYGQAEDQGTATIAPESLNIDDLPYRLKGADIPRYHLVRSFLTKVDNKIRKLDDKISKSADKFYGQFLDEIGVDRGSRAEESLRRAAQRYSEWAYGPSGPTIERWKETSERRDGTVVPATVTMTSVATDHGPQLSQKDDATLQAEAQAFHVKQARELADIYYDLLTDMEESGVSASSVERYLYNTIAAHSSVSYDEPHNGLLSYERAFDERLKSREKGRNLTKGEK